MSTVRKAAAVQVGRGHGKCRDGDRPDAERLERRRDPHDVDERVVRAELIQPHLLERHAVHARLGLTETSKDGRRAGTNTLCEPRAFDACEQVERAPSRVHVIEAGGKTERERAESCPRDLGRPDLDASAEHRGDRFLDRCGGCARVEEGREQHVPRGATHDVDVEAPHAPAPVARRAIIDAM
jgi:hypothetical protein